MSATRLSDSKTTSASPYLGSLWLPAASDRKRIDKFGSSTSSAASSSPPPTAPDSFPYTTPPPGALVFKQHVHRYPKPMEPSQKFRLWYRGLFWETLEPVSPFSPPVKVEKRIARCQTFPHRGPGKSPTRLQTFLEDLAEGDRPRAISGRTSSRHQLPSGNATVGANKYRPSFATYLQWENVLVHALLIALVWMLYFAVSHVVAPAQVARLTGRAKWYLTGVAVASNPANSTLWPHL